MGIVIGEAEAVAAVVPCLIGLHGILEAAGLADDGHGAVAHGDHLAQSTGLALGGHEEQIRAGVDGHGEGLVIVKAHGKATGILLRRPGEELLKPGVALAQNHHLHRKLHHILQHGADQVQALVGDKAADDGKDGDVGVLVQAHHMLQGSLVCSLAGHIRGGVVCADALVGGRIVELHVNAVEHAAELIVALAHDALQPVGKVSLLELTCVSGRNSVDGVGAKKGALDEVHVAVHHDGAVVGPAGIQAENVFKNVPAIPALILDVMDGEDGFDGTEVILPYAVILEVDGDQCGLPVVAVDHIGPELHMMEHAHNGPGEEGEALGVIVIAVEVRAVEVLLVIHEVPGHAVLLHGEQPAVAVAPAQVHEIVAHELKLIGKLVADAAVKGHHHGHFRTLLRQGGRQRAGNIGQTACFTEGNGFAGSVQNFHKLSPLILLIYRKNMQANTAGKPFPAVQRALKGVSFPCFPTFSVQVKD